jgi:hypothetical protein
VRSGAEWADATRHTGTKPSHVTLARKRLQRYQVCYQAQRAQAAVQPLKIETEFADMIMAPRQDALLLEQF